MSLVMTAEERESFLAGTHIGVIAVTRGGRAPLVVPIWYGYQPGGEIVIWILRGSLKATLIGEAGRFSLCAQVETPPYKYVTAEGPVVGVDEPADYKAVVAITKRYLPDGEAEAFVKENLADSITIRMRPEKWLSTDYSKA